MGDLIHWRYHSAPWVTSVTCVELSKIAEFYILNL